jgi:phage terminase large subunit-like protein
MNEVQQYIDDCLSGKRPAGKWIRLVLQRHLDELQRQHDDDFAFYYDEDAAARPITFIESHCTTSEDITGQPMRLLPWQKTWISLLYGWQRKSDDTRRFRRTFLCVAKKNGKTAVSAALSLSNLVADYQESARVVIAATTREQGKHCLIEAAIMRQKSPFLTKHLTQTGGKTDIKQVTALSMLRTNSRLSVMSRDAKTEDGAKVTHCVIDELHRWDTKEGLYMVLLYGGRASSQPLMIEISTAGDAAGNTSPCWDEFETGMKCLDPDVTDPSEKDDEYLPFLYVMDEKDDFTKEENWYKSNPSMGPKSEGYLFDIATMRSEFHVAKGSQRSIFKRYALNIWAQTGEDPAIEIEQWDACCRVQPLLQANAVRLRKETEEEMAGRPCFGALDPATKNDTSALSLVFPPLLQGEPWRSLEYFWIPKDNLNTKGRKDKVPYDLWAADGFLIPTPGNAIDKRVIARDILTLSKKFDMRELVYDEAHATEVISMMLEEGFPEDKLSGYPQTRIKMSEPCHNWALKIDRKEIAQDNNPVMRWQVGNLIWNRSAKDPNEIMPDKRRGREKIDGCVAQIMAFARATSPENIVKPKRKFFIAFPSEE